MYITRTLLKVIIIQIIKKNRKSGNAVDKQTTRLSFVPTGYLLFQGQVRDRVQMQGEIDGAVSGGQVHSLPQKGGPPQRGERDRDNEGAATSQADPGLRRV